MYQIVHKSKVNIIDDNSYISDISNNNTNDLDSDFNSTTSSFEIIMGVDIFNIIINSFYGNQRFKELKYLINNAIYQLIIMVMDVENRREYGDEFYDVTELVKSYNASMSYLFDIYNEYINIFNIHLHFGLGKIAYNNLVLKNYILPISQRLFSFANTLKNNVSNLHGKVSSIPSMVPRFKSVEELNKEISDALK